MLVAIETGDEVSRETVHDLRPLLHQVKMVSPTGTELPQRLPEIGIGKSILRIYRNILKEYTGIY